MEASKTQPDKSPLYYRIAAHLRDRIEAGELQPHQPVPSERVLSSDFDVSRMTARQAIATLEREGYVYRYGSRGTFVSEPRIELRIGSFSDEVSRRGGRPGARVLHTETLEPSGLVQEALGLGSGSRADYVQRLRLVDDEPLALENTYLPSDLCPGLLAMDLTGSIWAVLDSAFGIRATRSSARIEAVGLDPFEAAQLDAIVGDPAVLLTRLTFDQDGRPFELARDIYRGDRAEFAVDAELSGKPGLSSMRMIGRTPAAKETAPQKPARHKRVMS